MSEHPERDERDVREHERHVEEVDPAERSPVASSIWVSSLPVISTSPGVRTLGSMIASSRSPAHSTTVTRSR